MRKAVGKPDAFAFDMIDGGTRYRCMKYFVGRAREPYYFVFRDGVLERVVARTEVPDVSVVGGTNDPPRHPGYLVERAKAILALPDIPAPPDPAPPPRSPKDSDQAVGMMIGMAPFVVVWVPIAGPVWLVAYTSQTIKYDPERITPGATAEQAEDAFGPSRYVWRSAGGVEWRRYAPEAFPFPGKIIYVLITDGHVRAVFGEDLVDDWYR